MGFLNEFDKATTVKETENGALAYTTTDSRMVDFFAAIGGMRQRDEKDIIDLYISARKEDKELADKVILYARDIRGGLGERRIGKILLKTLANIDPQKVIRNFQLFVDMGRFDDLYCLEGTKVEDDMWKFMKETILTDYSKAKEGKPISLAAKWMKSINTSSKESKRLAKKFCSISHMSEKAYRKMLSALRSYTKVVETKMSANQWESINYETVPSVAMKRYSCAFDRRDFDRFNEFKSAVASGKAKINATTLYPYDIMQELIYNGSADRAILEAQWKALPDYFKEGHNVICCADVSGSMYGQPMAASIGLAMYCAAHNTGDYHGYFLTFTDYPRFFKLDENESLEANVNKVAAEVGYNTNLDGMLSAVYNMAVKAQESPEALLIVSDCEIDRFNYDPRNYEDIVETWTKRYKEQGLTMPKLIFWNVAARQNTFLSKHTNPYVSFVSGCSASTFANLTQLINLSAYEAMRAILDKYEFN